MARPESVLQRINTELEEGWEGKLNPDGRIYYVNHKAQTTSWLPPRENWASTTGLPFGWETGMDRSDKEYFINHVDRYTTRDDPRLDPDYIEPPRPREVELQRDPEKGFGFVAGSEKPVVVRFVTEGGPSEDQLLPGDQILKINGEEVRRAPREKVIELVRSCKQSIVLTVCQPYTDNSTRKSALLTAAKKAKLKSNPSRVRFADAVMVNGASVVNTEHSPSPVESYVPFMPNVLKVFLENGQTKSFKYDNKTTVKDVVVSLQEKLNIRCVHHFSLVLQNMKNNTGTAAKMTLLQDQETLADIAARPGARYFRCLFRVTFVPKDAYDLLKEDPIAFEYFYLQCCNDVLHERFASEMKYDTALRLAALQIQQHAMSNNMSAKVSIKAVVKECGLDKFVSKSLMESMKGKDLKRMLAQYLKMNQSLAAPGQKHLTALQAKLHYMKIVSELKTFGSRVFMVTLLDKRTEAMLLVGPHSGVSIVTNIKSYALTQLADFEHIDHVKVTKDGENMHRVDLKLRGQRAEVISLGLLSEDAQNFVCMVAGYYRIFVDPDKRVVERTIGKNTTDPDVPSYESVHRVQAAPWSYPEDLVSEVVVTSDADVSDNERRVDLSQDPPEYTENQEYLAKIKQDLGIESGQRVSSNHLERPINVSTIVVSPALPLKSKVNGAASTPFEEGVTSFGTASSDSSSLGSSFSSQGNNSATVLHGGVTSLAAQPTFNTTIDLRRNPAAANGHATGGGMDGAVGLAESERSSDTDSLSTADTERRPLLGAGAGGGGQQNGEVRVNSVDGESDESDSFGTPSGSPAKARLIQRVSSVESGMHSFGLHSPDMLPAADVDFQRMDSLPPEVYSAIYNPGNMIPPQKLYFDPDIIDLTIFPMADAPEDESMIDFTALSSLPPPSFANPSAAVFTSHNATSDQPSDFTGPAFGHHGNTGASHRLERSASTGHCPDFFDTDIDSIIAQYYVPPPPSSSDTDSSRSQVFSQSFSGVMPRDSNQQPPSTIELDDDFSSLIIPPPPSTSQVEEVPVVPPAPSGAGERRRNFRHKRSSSVDIGSLNAAKKQLEEAEKRRSLDIQQQQSGESEARRNSPPHSLGVESAFDADVHGGLAAESPATVSLKLHNLLKSLPNFAPEVATANQQQQQQPFFRTGSLRIHRSSSLDVVPGPGAPGLNGHDPQMSSAAYGQRTMFAGTASLGRLSGRRAVSQERLFSQGVPMYGVNGAHVNGGHQDVGDTQQQQTPSESFASLKAKLKDYRDSLLKRSRKNSTSEDSGSETGDGGKKKSSLRRSNSFSRLLNQLSGRKGGKAGDPVVVGDGNWTLRSRSSNSSSNSANDLASLFVPPGGEGEEAGGEKRAPTVREMFAVPRTSLRPVSTTAGGNQSKSKKSGPLKALSSVFTSEEKNSDGGKLGDYHPHLAAGTATSTAPSSSSSTLAGKKKNSPIHASKDDLSMTRKKDKNKVKANPYATIKMWRPITMTSSVSHDEDVYRTFTNFDVLVDEAKLPATGDLRNDDFHTGIHADSTALSTSYASSPGNGFLSGSSFNDKSPLGRSLSSNTAGGGSLYSNSDHNGHHQPDDLSVSSRQDSRRSMSPVSRGEASGRKAPAPVVTVPLIPRSVSMDSDDSVVRAPPRRSRQRSSPSPTTDMNGDADIPADYPQHSSPSLNSLRARSVSADSRDRADSNERRGRTVTESSYMVVSPDVASSVKGVLIKTYGPEGFDAAAQDVEGMLGQLKLTMETLKTAQARVSSSGSQFQTVKQELQLQTKQFVQDAKCMVTAATGSREAIAKHLHAAMHTLAKVLLHSQATMVRMRSVHQAQHLGFEIIKVSASFKSTVAAANAAIGKPTTEPHMKYLMRQATNLAGLLSTLLKTLKNLDQN